MRKLIKACFIGAGFVRQKFVGAIARIRAWALLPGIGPGSRCPLSVDLKFPSNIRVGSRVAIGPECTIGAKEIVTLEDDVRISKGVTIETASLDLSKPVPYPHVAAAITIKRGVWLGARCIVLGGVTIGEYAVIGAGAIVSKDVAPGEVVVSARSRVITTIPPVQ